MSLTALVAGERVDATILTDEQWTSLSAMVNDGQVIAELDCCKGRVLTRRSPLGTPHFYHRPERDCAADGSEMSPEHLALQNQVAKACRQQGWEAICECNLRERRADVLARKADQTVVFEVQVSPITVEILNRRSQSYREKGFEFAWMLGPDLGEERFAGRPVVHLAPQLDQLRAGAHVFPVEQFVTLVLAGDLRFRARMARRTVTTTWRHARKVSCVGCGASNAVVQLLSERHLATGCGGENRQDLRSDPPLRLLPSPGLRAWLQADAEGRRLQLANARPRPADDPWYSCARCGRHLHHKGQLPIPLDILDKRQEQVQLAHRSMPHWCRTGTQCA